MSGELKSPVYDNNMIISRKKVIKTKNNVTVMYVTTIRRNIKQDLGMNQLAISMSKELVDSDLNRRYNVSHCYQNTTPNRNFVASVDRETRFQN